MLTPHGERGVRTESWEMWPGVLRDLSPSPCHFTSERTHVTATACRGLRLSSPRDCALAEGRHRPSLVRGPASGGLHGA